MHYKKKITTIISFFIKIYSKEIYSVHISNVIEITDSQEKKTLDLLIYFVQCRNIKLSKNAQILLVHCF